MTATMRVLTWNIQALRGATDEKLDRVVGALERHAPDVVALQEVHSFATVPDRLRARLASNGLSHFHFSGAPAVEDKPFGDKKYGNVIASRWSVEPRSWPVAVEWPQLLAAATVQHPIRSVDVVSVHIPNGSGNGWQKVYALEAVVAGLSRSTRPTVVAGDFNEPMQVEPQILSFGADRLGRLDGTFRDLYDVVDDRTRWQDAVVAMLAPAQGAGWNGRHVASLLGVKWEVTHLVGGRLERRFDHVLLGGAEGLTARAIAYDHSVRTGASPISDHSLVVADFDVRG